MPGRREVARASPPDAPNRAAAVTLDFDRVAVQEVSRHFGRRRALSRVSFEIRRGEILGLLGPNGAGKSTLLSLLATLLKPTTGRIVYGDDDAAALGDALRGRIGVLGHDLYLYPELTARENLAFFAGLYHCGDPQGEAAAALARAGLGDRAHDAVSGFSRGMRQRVALERALIHGPRLVLLDEPFTGLDDASTAALVGRLRGLRNDGAIVVLATHDLDLVDGLLDRAIFLREGRMLEAGRRGDGLRTTYRALMVPEA